MHETTITPRPIEVLLVEDNPGDIRLMLEALKESKLAVTLHVVTDGIEAMDYLNRRGDYVQKPLPDLICLDLNLPRMDGRQVLEEIKADATLRTIPVAVLTTSKAEEDILRSYNLHANCYITKPLDLARFAEVVQAIEYFWFSIVTLPPRR
jgi:chemotaxis family two-component system response regulator Rcp1